MALVPAPTASPSPRPTSSSSTAVPPGQRCPNASCPCSDAKLCSAITRTGPEKAFVFHDGYAGDEFEWRQYDWTQISTISLGYSISPQLLCHAHSLGVRVVRGIDFPPADQWDNDTAVSAYISDHVANMKSCHLDGYNLDVEVADTLAQSRSMVALARRFTAAMHAAVPGSQVSFDVDSLAAPCSGNPTKPDYIYDVVGLAKAVDFLVVMDYDSANNPAQQPFFKGPMALPLLKVGVERFQQLGVPPSSLVLAMPWYGYEWIVDAGCSGNGTCPGAEEHHYLGIGSTGPKQLEGFTCRAGVYKMPGPFFFNLSCPSAYGLLPHANHGEEWDPWSQTPFLRYTDPHQGTAYEVWYENQKSLALKYAYAKEVGVRGVGMWQANSINYQNKSQVDGIWGSLRSFTTDQASTRIDV